MQLALLVDRCPTFFVRFPVSSRLLHFRTLYINFFCCYFMKHGVCGICIIYEYNSHLYCIIVLHCHCVSYITGASNWYWLAVGQGLLSLYWVRVEGECFYFFCFFTFIPVPLSSLSLSFISSTLSSISFLPFSGRRHKMTLKGWRVVKPQHNQSICTVICHNVCFIIMYAMGFTAFWNFEINYSVLFLSGFSRTGVKKKQQQKNKVSQYLI